MAIVILDGAMGTELLRRGVATNGVAWSGQALDVAPDVVRAIHRDYLNAGARVLTPNTFRTTPRASGEAWRARMRHAVAIAREVATGVGEEPEPGLAPWFTGEAAREVGEAVPPVLVAGSMAPLEDCYRPDLTPPDDVLRREHREIAVALAECECDVILGETFASPREAVIATECAARAAGDAAKPCDVWTSLTAGYRADLLSPEKMRETARDCIAAGARAILVNCVPAHLTRAYVDAIASAVGAASAPRVPFGAYANLDPHAADYVHRSGTYLEYARSWIASGATMIGGCCGTTPDHIAALRTLLT